MGTARSKVADAGALGPERLASRGTCSDVREVTRQKGMADARWISASGKGCTLPGRRCAVKNAAFSRNTFLKGDRCNR